MYLAPSDIHFLRDYTCECLTPDEALLSVLSEKLLQANELPKMQVVERNGAWFALNNSHLHVFRQLERQGKCPCRVRVDVVSLSKVPKSVQETMVVEETIAMDDDEDVDDDVSNDGQHNRKMESGPLGEHQLGDNESPTISSGRATKRGYQKLSDVNGDEDDLSLTTPDLLQQPDSSETENTTSSFSGTDNSDYDHREADRDVDSDSDYDESLTCNVCDRSFPSVRKLTQHQQRKRHYGCSVCDSIFPSLMTLELHKESLEHWSEDDDDDDEDEDEDEDDDDDDDGGNKSRFQNRGYGGGGELSDDSDADVHSPTEELERLL